MVNLAGNNTDFLRHPLLFHCLTTLLSSEAKPQMQRKSHFGFLSYLVRSGKLWSLQPVMFLALCSMWVNAKLMVLETSLINSDWHGHYTAIRLGPVFYYMLLDLLHHKMAFKVKYLQEQSATWAVCIRWGVQMDEREGQENKPWESRLMVGI